MCLERSVEFLIENAARHEGQLQRIRDLIEGGIQRVASSYPELNCKTDAVLDSHLRIQRMIDSLKTPRNGHSQ
jgi:hypothetical protein